jgi:hypothetical protein
MKISVSVAHVTANVFTDIPCSRQKLKPKKTLNFNRLQKL